MIGKGTVLIVDDDAAILFLVQEVLNDENYRVLVSADGSALRCAHEQQPDLILLDLVVPTLDGQAVIRELRANPVTAHIPIVALSARSNLAALATEMHLDGMLAKPFDLDELLRIVEYWVVQSRQPRAG